MADCYAGFDTSNYTTSIAVVTAGSEVLANLKAPLPVKPGEVGLRQSEAVFAHVKNLPGLTVRLAEVLNGHRVLGVGVSAKPRDAEDSYMPCFLSGVAAATAFAAGCGAPLLRFSHQNGHIMAALASSGEAECWKGHRFGAFHVSGGTTEMLMVTPRGNDFTVELVGGTADLNAGQAVDRVGVALGLSFPCGPALENLAGQNTKKIPTPVVSVREGKCNLSGLENKALALYRESGDAALTAAYVQRFIAGTLEKMALWLRREDKDLPILFAGGVMSNRTIAADLRAALGNVAFAEPAFSADNAAGIAFLCRAELKNREK